MATGTYLPRSFLTNAQKLARGIWPWTVGIRSRFPLHYKRHFADKYMMQPTAVHYVPDERRFKLNEQGVKVRVQNVPIPLKFPRQADEGLWGGEGIIQGYTKRKNKAIKPRHPKIWVPSLVRRVFYSEILDQWMAINVTQRTLNLIDDAFGFDFYILKTPAVDLASQLGMRLKREMLTVLSKRSMYPDDPVKANEVYERYKQFLIPADEIEWIGLSLEEAERKQEEIEAREAKEQIRPMKQAFFEQMVEQLKSANLEDESPLDSKSWKSKLNPFK